MHLQVLTLNSWGLLFIGKRRAARLRLIATYLKECTADLVFLQEVWLRADADRIMSVAAEGRLKHAHHFVAGLFGAGLITLSHFPLSEARFWGYTAAGDPLAFTNGDYLAGKGVGWARLSSPAGFIDTFNTHLSANYDQQFSDPGDRGFRVSHDKYAAVRVAQMLQLTAFVHSCVKRDTCGVLLAGDLNCPPDTMEIQLLKALLPGLRDCWQAVHPEDPGPTANSPNNSFSTTGAGKQPVRIDYIWTTGEPERADLVMGDTGRGYSYSDHTAVQADMRIQPSAAVVDDEAAEDGRQGKAPTPQAERPVWDTLGKGALWRVSAKDEGTAPILELHRLAVQIMTEGMQRAHAGARRYAAASAIDLVLTAVILGFQIAGWWWPGYPSPLYVVLQVLLAAGCVFWPIALLLGWGARHGEGQALEECLWETELALKDVLRRGGRSDPANGT